jgi:Flp pilus assembly protein TadD
LRNPEFPAATRDLAQLYAKAGRNYDAKRVYSELLAIEPTDTTALVGLAEIAVADRKWSEAIDLLNKARTAAAFDPPSALKLIGLYELRRDWNSAKPWRPSSTRNSRET